MADINRWFNLKTGFGSITDEDSVHIMCFSPQAHGRVCVLHMCHFLFSVCDSGGGFDAQTVISGLIARPKRRRGLIVIAQSFWSPRLFLENVAEIADPQCFALILILSSALIWITCYFSMHNKISGARVVFIYLFIQLPSKEPDYYSRSSISLSHK